MKSIYIFTNWISLCQSKSIVTTQAHKEKIETILEQRDPITIEDIIIHIDDDSSNHKTLENPNYIALHKEPQGNSINDWREKNREAIVASFHHSNNDGTFYKDIIPKVLDGSLKLKDIERYFPTTLSLGLDFVHRVKIGKKWDNNDGEKYNEILEVEHFEDVMRRRESNDYDSLSDCQKFVDVVIKIQYAND